MSKATNKEVFERVNVVIQLIIQGKTRDEILNYIVDEMNLSVQSAKLYYGKAWKRIKKQGELNRSKMIALAKRRYHDLYDKCYCIQDYRECRAIQADINKLAGLNAPDKHELTGKDGGPIAVKGYIGVNPDDWDDENKD